MAFFKLFILTVIFAILSIHAALQGGKAVEASSRKLFVPLASLIRTKNFKSKSGSKSKSRSGSGKSSIYGHYYASYRTYLYHQWCHVLVLHQVIIPDHLHLAVIVVKVVAEVAKEAVKEARSRKAVRVKMAARAVAVV